MDEKPKTPLQQHPLGSRETVFALLFRVLARLFSYPSTTQVDEITATAFITECARLITDAAINEPNLSQAYTQVENVLQSGNRHAANSLRAEYSRLFFSPPPPISLRGSQWIRRQNITPKNKGEAFAVNTVYRQIGLRIKDNVTDPADHLVSELDYMSYVAEAEALAWRGDDIASAREWRRLGIDFKENHLATLAFGVSDAVKRISSNPFMLFYAALLHAILASDYYEA